VGLSTIAHEFTSASPTSDSSNVRRAARGLEQQPGEQPALRERDAVVRAVPHDLAVNDALIAIDEGW
jgi:hypothetical protein